VRAGIRSLVVLAIVAGAGFGVYRWWSGPDGQIRRVLDDISETLSHDTPLTALETASRVAGLRDLLAPDIVISPGQPLGPIHGRDAAIAMAARISAGAESLEVEFVDINIAVTSGGTAATVDLTAKVTVRNRGQETVDAREVVMEFAYLDGGWVVRKAEAIAALERMS
jgi:hypothetical protein